MRRKFLVGCLVAAIVTAAIVAASMQGEFSVLNTSGQIANQQRDLLIWVVVLMLLVVVPVFWLTAHIVWKYRHDNHKATYAPEWDGNRKLETIWWGFPTVIILILSVIIWQTSHSLDPYRSISTASNKKPMTVQVVALQWKWLFIYPEQDIATVNYVAFPEDTPVKFEITADAPMNSFWIPKLGGQVYAMSGMRTSLHLAADAPGVFRGSSANLSGEGFAKMSFDAVAMTDQNFSQWIDSVSEGHAESQLDDETYAKLKQPGTSDEQYYGSTVSGLQATIIDKYGSHGGQREKRPHSGAHGTEPSIIEGFRD